MAPKSGEWRLQRNLWKLVSRTSPAWPRSPGWIRVWCCGYDSGFMRYSADITTGALKVAESRVVADLLLRGVSSEQWNHAISVENVLQARSGVTAVKLGRLLRRRLTSMGPELWKLARDGSGMTATHACLAGAVKCSALLGDFMNLVLRDEYRAFTPALNNRMWEDYLAGCRNRDPEMGTYSETTSARLRSTVFQVLAQAGYLEDTRSLKLQKVHIDGKVLQYLLDRDEKYVLRCMQVTE